MKRFRAILNGKKAGEPALREAIFAMREQGTPLEVRVTWESADMLRLVEEASQDGIERILVAGGDGSLNEAVNALDTLAHEQRPELAVIPMGTANDFATANRIPTTIAAALELAIHGQTHQIDYVKANNRCFINVAAAGFGAEITAETPIELKNFLGGGAYTLTGIVKALGFRPYEGTLSVSKGSWTGDILVGAFCNSRLAGGGQEMAPYALINDGDMDVTVVRPFLPHDLPQVIEEIKNPKEDGEFVVHLKTNWLEIDFPKTLPLNLDGEPYHSQKIRFEVQHQALAMVLPDDSPCLR